MRCGLQSLTLQLNAFGLRGLFCGKHRQLQPPQLHLGVLHHLRLGGHIHLELRSRLIDQIDRLVGQTAIADVTVGQPSSCCHRVIRDRDAVVQLIALLHPPENLDAVINGRLRDGHLLKTPVQCRVFLNGAPIILRGRGGNTAQITPRQRRLEKAAGICTVAVTVDHRVQFINKQHHSRFRITDLLQHLTQALLKLTTELGTGDQRPRIEGHKPQTLKRFRHLTSHHALSQQFGNRRFSHTRSTDQHRVVLAAARQHLDQAADLGIPAHHWIQLAVGSFRCEIPAEPLKGCCLSGRDRLRHGFGRLGRGWQRCRSRRRHRRGGNLR